MNNEEILQSLEVVAIRCEAWRDFFKLDVLNLFDAFKGEIFEWNYYNRFDELMCQFPYKPKSVPSLFRSLMRPGQTMPIQFERDLLYDSRGWCTLPLNCFVPVELPPNEIPTIKVGLRDMPWSVTSDCFKLYHKVKWNDRIAEMYFEHPNEAHRPRHNRNRNRKSLNKLGQRVHEQKFPLDAKRPDMHAVMLEHVRTECAKHAVRIVDLDVLDRLEGREI